MTSAPDKLRGNIWYNWPGGGCAPTHQLTEKTFAGMRPYDVAILGAGVIGCALAYLLSQYRLRTVLIDRAYDVGEGTSKGNSAIIHTGFDATPGSLESQFVTSAARQWPALAEKLKIPFKTISALMLALNEEQSAQLPVIREKALANGVDDVELVTAAEARRLEPNIAAAVCGGLVVPRESIVDPFTTSIAYAEVAVENGVDLVLGLEISGINRPSYETKTLVGTGGVHIPARCVINACGLGSRRLVAAYGGELMDLNPRRGQFVVYDRDCSHLVSRILLPIPTKQTKGMLVAPTIFGNLLAGPTAEDLPPDQPLSASTTADGLSAVRTSARQMCPALHDQPVIATYAGLRCNCAQGSFWIRFNDGQPGIVTLAGIRSTGLTASISTAQYVIERLRTECGLTLQRNERAVDSRPECKWPGWWRRPFDDPQRIAACPDYGRIVCSCENISRGEIQDALASSAGTATLDGLKRRTRVLTGRCQGFNCGVPVAEMISRHFQIPLPAVTRRGPGTEFISGSTGVPRCVAATTARPRDVAAANFRVVIVGAGPAGIGAAIGLASRGVAPVLLIDRAGETGGVPAHYHAKPGGVPTFVVWSRGRVVFGRQLVDDLRRKLEPTNTEVWLECQAAAVDRAAMSITILSPAYGRTKVSAEAFVFACGARERSAAERGWIVGDRSARQLFTMQLLQLIDGCGALPLERPTIIGSDLVAYSAAAKLYAAGAERAALADRRSHPAASLLERLYFGRWCRPAWHPVAGDLAISAGDPTMGLPPDRGYHVGDGIVLSGELVPNSELIVAAGLAVQQPSRIPVCRGRNELPSAGWYIAGAARGGFHGADWCYRDGVRAAGAVAAYLRQLGYRLPRRTDRDRRLTN